LLALVLLAIQPASGQIAFWQHYLGSPGVDRGLCMLPRPDGTLVIGAEVGGTAGLGKDNHSEESDVVIFKYATQGKRFWTTTLGGSGRETLADLIETPDAGYLGIGTSTSADGDPGRNQGGEDIWVFKIDYLGRLEWSKTFGGRGDDRGLTLTACSDGTFLIGGESASPNGDMFSLHHGGLDSWVARLDDRGVLLWERHYGGAGNEKVSRIHELSPDETLVIHTSDSRNGDVRANLGGKDVWMTRIDPGGEILWQANFGGTANDEVHDSYFAPNGDLILAGTTFSSDGHIPEQRGEGDMWLFCLDAGGGLRWSHTYGGPRAEGASALAPCADGGYVLVGMTKSRTGEGQIEYNAGYFDGWLLKVDSLGIRQWSRTGGAEGVDGLNAIFELPGGGFVTLGYAQQKAGGTMLPGHKGIIDLWLANFSDPQREGVRPFVTPPILLGTVLSKHDGLPLPATITLTENATLDSLSSATTQPADGSFLLLMPAYGLVSINVLAKGYMFYGRDILMDTVINQTSIEQTFKLEPVRIGSSLILENIYFDPGKWELLPPSYAELERVLAFLKLNPRIHIQVSGHTDNTGNRQQKVQLSLNRANAVRDYLEKRGIPSYRMQVKGYGMYRPIADNRSPEGRRRNRRVEFEVINM